MNMIVAECEDTAVTGADEPPVRHASGIAGDGSEWCLGCLAPWPCLPVLEIRAAAEDGPRA